MPLFRREQAISKKQLEQLYLGEYLSMAEIAEKLKCSVKVVYWMDRHEIARRHWDEASYVKHNPNGDPFQIKELATDDDRELFQLGLGLYIGEGTKHKQQVRLTNTNPEVIRAFLRFLREICGVEEKKIFVWLNIFDDIDFEETQAYWEQVTDLPRSQFYKPTIRPSKGETYLNKSRYGTITVGISSTKLSSKIGEWSESALRKFSS